jgi:hypothetical protein
MREHFIGIFGSDFDLDDEEKALFNEAKKNKAAAAHVKGRAKTKLGIMDLFQPFGEEGDELSYTYKINEAYQQFGVIRGADGRIDLDASYRSRAALARQKREYELKSPLFTAASGEFATDTAIEQLSFAMDTVGDTDRFFKAMELAGRPRYRRNMDYAYMSLFGMAGDDQSQVSFRKSVIENELRRKIGVVGTVDPEWQSMQELIKKGPVSRDDMGPFLFGSRVSDTDLKAINVLFDLYKKLTDIEQVLIEAKAVPQPVRVDNQPPAQPRKPAAEALGQ